MLVLSVLEWANSSKALEWVDALVDQYLGPLWVDVSVDQYLGPLLADALVEQYRVPLLAGALEN